jgi:hypothetical protein
MGLGTTTWAQALPVVAVAALLMVVPGALAARWSGTSWSTALAVGPLLTTTTLTVAGVLAPAVGLSWSPWVFGAAALGVCALGGLLGLALRRQPDPEDDGRNAAGHGAGGGDGRASAWSLLAATGIALAGVAAVVLPTTGRPTAFPQSPDTIYHLGTIEWMVQGRDISVLHAGGFASPSGTGFYPAAFHDFAATLAMLTGASPVVAASSTILVIAGIVWPLGLDLLARQVLGHGWWPSLAAGLGAIAFSSFPFWLMGYGVLWPNVYGQAMLPAALVLLTSVVTGPRRLRDGLLLVVSIPGLALAHPNALIAFGLIAGAIVVGAALRAIWRDRRERPRRAVVRSVGVLIGLAAFAGAWMVVTQASAAMRASNPKGPEMSVGDALVDGFFFAPRNLSPMWLVGVVVLVGAVVLVVRRRGWWVVVAHVAFGTLYVLDAGVDSRWTRLLTWPWYNNSPRLAALMVVTGALLFAAALTGLAEWSARALRGRGAPWLAPAALAVVLVAGTAGLGYNAHHAALAEYFDLPADESFASTAELDGLRVLGRQVPASSVVAANPWKGATYLYLTSGRRLLFPTEKAYVPGDREILGRRLDEAATDPAVCAAARRLSVDYVITGGTSMTASGGQKRRYRGIDDVPQAPGFRRVASAGGFDLYHLDACK